MATPEVQLNPHRIHAGLVDKRLVRDLVERHTGERPARLIARATKAPRLVYEATLDDGCTVIFKAEVDTRGDDAIVLEAWAMERAREAGVPAPRVLALDASGAAFPGRYAIFEQASGAPLPPVWRARTPDEADLAPEAMRRAFRAAGAALRRLHALPIPGYGRLDDERYLRTGEVRGRSKTWREVTLDPALAAVEHMVERGVVHGDDAGRLHAAIAAHQGVLAECGDGRLLHGDFAAKHIYVEQPSGDLTAVIDFGDREAGDPAFDVANFVLWEDDERLGWLREGYGEVDGGFGTRVRAYALADTLRLAHSRLLEGRTADAAPVIGRLRAMGERLLGG